MQNELLHKLSILIVDKILCKMVYPMTVNDAKHIKCVLEKNWIHITIEKPSMHVVLPIHLIDNLINSLYYIIYPNKSAFLLCLVTHGFICNESMSLLLWHGNFLTFTISRCYSTFTHDTHTDTHTHT